MEDFGDISLGFVFSRKGADYYSVQPVKHATDYEKFLLCLGCKIKVVYILASTAELRYFLQMDYDYRKNVWAHPPKPQLH